MKQQGVVLALLDNKNAKVLVKRHSSCESCNACKMGREEKTIEIEAINPVNAQAGQNVVVDLEHQNVLKAAFIIYMIPLGMLLLGIIVTVNILNAINAQMNNELISALVGFALMAITFLVIRLNENKLKDKNEYVPVITEIIE